MRRLVLLLGISLLAATGAAQGADTPPIWAYPVNPHAVSPRPDNMVRRRLPRSKASFTEAGVNDRFHVADWYPQDHPALPPVVAHGRRPAVFACGYCHLPNGQGRPENAPLAGQPAPYLIEQVNEMKAGRRRTSQPAMGSIKAMHVIAAAVSPQELKIAAAYFSKLPYKKWIRVVESTMVPRFEISSHNMLVRSPRGGREKLGQRIVEMPENLERVELRDPHTGFVAYVPRGAVARGKTLVENGGGGFPCAACHGVNLKGVDNVPGLAGRSPSYLVRQLYDMQHGTRGGPATDPMKPEVERMTDASRIDIAAYLASLSP